MFVCPVLGLTPQAPAVEFCNCSRPSITIFLCRFSRPSITIFLCRSSRPSIMIFLCRFSRPSIMFFLCQFSRESFTMLLFSRQSFTMLLFSRQSFTMLLCPVLGLTPRTAGVTARFSVWSTCSSARVDSLFLSSRQQHCFSCPLFVTRLLGS